MTITKNCYDHPEETNIMENWQKTSCVLTKNTNRDMAGTPIHRYVPCRVERA